MTRAGQFCSVGHHPSLSQCIPMLTSDNRSTSFSHLHTSSKALFRKYQAEAPIARPAPAPPGELGCSPFSRSSSGQNKVSFQVPDNANSSTCSMMFLPLVESILSSSFFFFFLMLLVTSFSLFSCLTPLSPRYVTDVFSLLL